MFLTSRFFETSVNIFICLFLTVSLISCQTKKESDSSKSQQETKAEKISSLSSLRILKPAPPPDDSALPSECHQTSKKHDGTYSLKLQSQERQTALGLFTVKDGKFAGNIVNLFNEKTEVSGCITPDGRMVYNQTKNKRGTLIKVETKINERGVLEGSFSVGPRQENLMGSLNNIAIKPELVKEFDGEYQYDFLQNGKKIGSVSFVIADGVFAFALTSKHLDRPLRAWGYVASDGTITLNNITRHLEQSHILAQGKIDPKTREISGIYRLGDYVGTSQGKMISSAKK